jgi:hypothetical protein
MCFKGNIAVCCLNYTKFVNAKNTDLLEVTAGHIFGYHGALKRFCCFNGKSYENYEGQEGRI